MKLREPMARDIVVRPFLPEATYPDSWSPDVTSTWYDGEHSLFTLSSDHGP